MKTTSLLFLIFVFSVTLSHPLSYHNTFVNHSPWFPKFYPFIPVPYYFITTNTSFVENSLPRTSTVFIPKDPKGE